MREFEDHVLKTFIKDQAKLLGRDEFTTLDEADEFLTDCMAVKLKTIDEVREYLIDAGMDAYGLSDEELLAEAEVFALDNGEYLVVEG
ncbi:MAG: glyoxalase [Lachnospiraceae bacterium]|nr:glyoxalase [Lachnospiraceae bacterium]